MTYNCTLLKELPDFPAGTTFKIKEVIRGGKLEYACQFSVGEDANKMMLWNYLIPRAVIDNPKWVKKELDETCLTDVKCKACGSTKLLLEARNADYHYDDGVYYYKMKIVGVCPCGCENEFIKFTTHKKVIY